MGWPDVHWLARDKGELVAAMFESADGGRVGSLWVVSCPHRRPTVMGSIGNLVICDGVDWYSGDLV
jgi:hypothetical protein